MGTGDHAAGGCVARATSCAAGGPSLIHQHPSSLSAFLLTPSPRSIYTSVPQASRFATSVLGIAFTTTYGTLAHPLSARPPTRQRTYKTTQAVSFGRACAQPHARGEEGLRRICQRRKQPMHEARPRDSRCAGPTARFSEPFCPDFCDAVQLATTQSFCRTLLRVKTISSQHRARSQHATSGPRGAVCKRAHTCVWCVCHMCVGHMCMCARACCDQQVSTQDAHAPCNADTHTTPEPREKSEAKVLCSMWIGHQK